jgi:hypothetical protein
MKFQGLYCSRIQLASQLLRGDIVQMATTNENDEQANIFSPFLDRAVKGPKLELLPSCPQPFHILENLTSGLIVSAIVRRCLRLTYEKTIKCATQATV